MLKAKKSQRLDSMKQAAVEEVLKQETTRLNAEIPISLHYRLKRQVVDEGKGSSMAKIVIKAVEEYLSKNSNSHLK